MTVSTENLDLVFADFVTYVKTEKKEIFTSFENLKFIDNPTTGENYKYEVYTNGRKKLDFQKWKAQDIGMGRIHENAINALKVKKNNLVNNYRLKENFAQIDDVKAIEQILFDFYKSKIHDSVSFKKFIDFGISYNVIAYLFFLKEKNKYLPISQRAFDDIFELIGLADFKTDGQSTFDNYIQYCDLIKQVQRYLKTKDKDATLIDAHSFLWILGKMNANTVNKPNSTKRTEYNPKTIKEINVNTQSKEAGLKENLTEIKHYVDKFFPDELPTETTENLFEGIKKTVTVNSYERNPKARQLCVKHWQAICAVCRLDFEKLYGEIGKGFIHVHHLTPVSKIGKTYQIDPIKDLIPVCPNCHSMLHRQEPPLTIEELIKIMKQEKCPPLSREFEK